MFPNHTVCCVLPQLTSHRGRHPWHVCRYSQTGLYWSTHPCPWLNISAEIVHSPSFKERKMSKFEMTRQSLQCSSLWNFFQPLQFAIKSAPSMSSLFNLLLSFEKESTLLLIASVINKLSTLSAPSMINFFFYKFQAYVAWFTSPRGSGDWNLNSNLSYMTHWYSTSLYELGW